MPLSPPRFPTPGAPSSGRVASGANSCSSSAPAAASRATFLRLTCPSCGLEEYEWIKASGKGSLYSYIVVHPPTLPVFKDDVPYPVVLVELEEGPRMVSNVVDCANEDLEIGMPLEVFFDAVTEDLTLPKFRPAAR